MSMIYSGMKKYLDKKNPKKLDNNITLRKNILDGINLTLDNIEQRLNQLEINQFTLNDYIKLTTAFFIICIVIDIILIILIILII